MCIWVEGADIKVWNIQLFVELHIQVDICTPCTRGGSINKTHISGYWVTTSISNTLGKHNLSRNKGYHSHSTILTPPPEADTSPLLAWDVANVPSLPSPQTSPLWGGDRPVHRHATTGTGRWMRCASSNWLGLCLLFVGKDGMRHNIIHATHHPCQAVLTVQRLPSCNFSGSQWPFLLIY